MQTDSRDLVIDYRAGILYLSVGGADFDTVATRHIAYESFARHLKGDVVALLECAAPLTQRVREFLAELQAFCDRRGGILVIVPGPALFDEELEYYSLASTPEQAGDLVRAVHEDTI